MAETPAETSAPETTATTEWLIPYQDLVEQVIDARLAAHSAKETASKKTTSSRTSSTKAADDKKADDSAKS